MMGHRNRRQGADDAAHAGHRYSQLPDQGQVACSRSEAGRAGAGDGLRFGDDTGRNAVWPKRLPIGHRLHLAVYQFLKRSPDRDAEWKIAIRRSLPQASASRVWERSPDLDCCNGPCRKSAQDESLGLRDAARLRISKIRSRTGVRSHNRSPLLQQASSLCQMPGQNPLPFGLCVSLLRPALATLKQRHMSCEHAHAATRCDWSPFKACGSHVLPIGTSRSTVQ